MEKLVPGVRKAPANFRWFTTPTSTIEMRFSERTRQPSANLPFGGCSGEWLTDFETPRVIMICKTPPPKTIARNTHNNGLLLGSVFMTEAKIRNVIE